jgi:phospholipid transport system substrate-binding protein
MKTKSLIRARRFRSIVVVAMIAVAFAIARAASADNGPLGTTQQFVNSALHIMADKQTPMEQRQSQLRDLLDPRFDFTQMSRSALGYHWKGLSPDQRASFTTVFKNFIESAYLSKIGDYAGQRVDFIKQSPLGDGFAQVFTNIVQTGKDPIPVNYLLEQKDGEWKVYDVTVDNISIIANYRNQFNRVINENGFDKLLADLKAKQQQLGVSARDCDRISLA